MILTRQTLEGYKLETLKIQFLSILFVLEFHLKHIEISKFPARDFFQLNVYDANTNSTILPSEIRRQTNPSKHHIKIIGAFILKSFRSYCLFPTEKATSLKEYGNRTEREKLVCEFRKLTEAFRSR